MGGCPPRQPPQQPYGTSAPKLATSTLYGRPPTSSTTPTQGVIGGPPFTPSTLVDINIKAQVGTTLKVGSFEFVVSSQPIKVLIVHSALFKKEDCP